MLLGPCVPHLARCSVKHGSGRNTRGRPPKGSAQRCWSMNIDIAAILVMGLQMGTPLDRSRFFEVASNETVRV